MFLGLTRAKLERMTDRNSFSDFLPYIAYDDSSKLYFNQDDTVGFMWECTPLYFSSKEAAKTLEGLFRLTVPDGSVMQFILYADPYVKPILDAYKATKVRENDLLGRCVNSLSDFMQDGTNGMPSTSGIPIRNFRLFVTLKMPDSVLEKGEDFLSYIKSSIQDILKGARLAPEHLEPNAIVGFLMRLFNDNAPENIEYNEDMPISKQVILADTEIKDDWNKLFLGKRCLKVTTPKSFPRESSIMIGNTCTGDVWGMGSDSDQILTPFFITYNIIFEPLKAQLHRKCSLTLQQQGFGSFFSALARRKDEFVQAVDQLECGESFFRIVPIVTVIGKNETEATDSVVRIKRLWERNGYVMQEDRGIITPLFLSSLPLGLYNIDKNVANLDRDFIHPASVICEMLPIQADFNGGGRPEMLFVGRKGQLASIDFFDDRAPNNNAFIAATSGGGKSFLVNYIESNYFANNTIMRLIDIGRSYEKTCSIVGGKFIEFKKDSQICLNPFTYIVDVNDDLHVISSIICQMIYSVSDAAINETEASLVKDAVRWAFENEGNDACIDTVSRYLETYPQYADSSLQNITHLKDIARVMAFNMRDFTSKGVYGKWFNGKSTLNFSSDEFVVLELEELKPIKELFKVVTLLILNAVTLDLYLSDRSRKRMIIFDEAWQFLTDDGFIGNVINEGYRRARKYGGSITTVTQSILDLKLFGSIGSIIKNNSAFHMFLMSKDFEAARKEGLLDYNPFQMELLASIGSNIPKYSEIFFHTPYNMGVGRLVVDKYSSVAYDSKASVNAELSNIVSQGRTYSEAITEYLLNKKKAA